MKKRTENGYFSPTGSITAMVTPFMADDESKIDYDTFGRLIEHQISMGTDAILVCGTTGESAALSDGERRDVIRFARGAIGGRVPLICGTGCNNLRYACELTEFACTEGADAVLVVAPYYNRANDRGLVSFYREIAKHSDRGIILYYVPSRTGVNITPAVCEELAEDPKFVAVKEASGSLAQCEDILDRLAGRMALLSGCDEMIAPLMYMGAAGAVTVVGNLLPYETKHMLLDPIEGGRAEIRYRRLIRALASDVNPIPIKTAMAAVGLCSSTFRLPLCGSDAGKEGELLAALKSLGGAER